mgnify:CR=1 FL=1
MAGSGPSHRRGWILRVRELSVRGSRAQDDIWDPISSPSPQKCERFLIFCNLNFKKSLLQGLNFLSKNVLSMSFGVGYAELKFHRLVEECFQVHCIMVSPFARIQAPSLEVKLFVLFVC